jgi:hypothetical protein
MFVLKEVVQLWKTLKSNDCHILANLAKNTFCNELTWELLNHFLVQKLNSCQLKHFILLNNMCQEKCNVSEKIEIQNQLGLISWNELFSCNTQFWVHGNTDSKEIN